MPAAWVRESWRAHSVAGEKVGYGYLWWIYEPGALGAAFSTLNRLSVYLARGTGGQAVFVIPQAEMVVVHRGDTDNGRSVLGPAIWQLVERLVVARNGEAVTKPRLVPMPVVPLTSNLPTPPEPLVIALGAEARRGVAGDYEIAPGQVARVFEFDSRLFMSIPGQGEAELFATAPLTFTIKVESGVLVAFQSGADGRVTGVEVTIGRQKIQAVRLNGAPPAPCE